MVWAGDDVVTEECPKSAIRGESLAWVELYWLTNGRVSVNAEEWPARAAEAMALIEGWVGEQVSYGTDRTK